MRRPIRRMGVLAVLLLPFLSSAAAAGPLDVRVGETRATWKRDGTPLKEKPETLSKAILQLAYGSRVIVREIKSPWLRVETTTPPGQSGWLKAAETVEPAALAPNPRPAASLSGASSEATQRDISTAGRQFGPDTERRYRTAQPNLQQGYVYVDRMEEETRRLDPAACVGFIQEGTLGQRGQDYVRPPLLPPTPPPAPRRGPNAAGKVLGGILDRLGPGGKTGDLLRKGLDEAVALGEQLQKNFTPDQEYYLGRAVAATAIARYGIEKDERRRTVVRQIGDAIVRLSRRLDPNFGGYHFDVLATDEVNAVSGPGGFVLVTRGAVDACGTEDELAAIIAHELAHVKLKHGESTLRQGKNFQAAVGGFVRFGSTAVGVDDDAIAGKLLEVFTQAVGEMARTSVEHSYGRGAEFESDMEGTYLLMDVVYDHRAMRDALRAMAAHTGAYGQSATHASPAVRCAQMEPVVQKWPTFPYGDEVLATRRARFLAALGRPAPAPR